MKGLARTVAPFAAVALLSHGSVPRLHPSTVLRTQQSGAALDHKTAAWTAIRVRAVPIRMNASEQFWETTLGVGPEGIVLRAKAGDRMALAASAVTALGYRRQSFRDSKVTVGTGIIPLVLPGRGAFGESGAHLIAIEFTDSANRRQGVLLEAKKGDYEAILRALAGATGLKVDIAGDHQDSLPADIPAAVVTDVPSGVFPGVPTLPVRWLETGKEVRSLAFSVDGTTVATGDAAAIRLWRTATGQTIRPPLAVKGGAPDQIVITPDGGRLVAGSYRALTVWNLAAGANVLQVPIDRRGLGPLSFALSPDGRRAAVTESRGSQLTLRLVDLQGGGVVQAALATWGIMAQPRVVFSADGERLLAWDGGPIRIWRSETGELAAEFPAPAAPAGAAGSLSADRKELRGIGAIEIARVAALSGHALAGVKTGLIEAGWVSGDRRYILTADSSRSARLWDAARLTPLGEPLLGHRGEEVHDAAFDPTGTRLATVTAGHAVIWDVRTQRPLGQCLTGPMSMFAGWNGPDWSHIWFAPDGRTIGIIRERAEYAVLCDVSALAGDAPD